MCYFSIKKLILLYHGSIPFRYPNNIMKLFWIIWNGMTKKGDTYFLWLSMVRFKGKIIEIGWLITIPIKRISLMKSPPQFFFLIKLFLYSLIFIFKMFIIFLFYKSKTINMIYTVISTTIYGRSRRQCGVEVLIKTDSLSKQIWSNNLYSFLSSK